MVVPSRWPIGSGKPGRRVICGTRWRATVNRAGPGLVSLTQRGDERFDYSDNPHRWVAPDPDYDQEVWTEMVRQHHRQHVEEISRCRKPRP